MSMARRTNAPIPGREHTADDPGAHGRGGVRAADRVRERREPAPRARQPTLARLAVRAALGGSRAVLVGECSSRVLSLPAAARC